MTPDIMISLICCFTFMLCLLMTRLLVVALPTLGLIDVPNDRRVHKKPTPRGGGLAILCAFSIGFYLLNKLWLNIDYINTVLLPVIIIGLVSFYDDIKYVNIWIRLGFHITIAAFISYNILLPNLLFHGELPIWLDFTLAFIAFAGFMNIYNFMDGIDGISASESIHLSITILLICLLRYDVIIHSSLIIAIASLVLACSLAFLIYNWHPAHVFLGDVGSIVLGTLIGLCLMLIAASGAKLFVSACIAPLYYLADGGITILVRAIKREKIWLPHVNHFFQQAARKRLSNNKITGEIILCNYWLMMLSIGALYYPLLSFMLAVILVIRVLVKFSEKKD